ncbi:PIPO, partial [Pea seed-borne mosaic virus]
KLSRRPEKFLHRLAICTTIATNYVIFKSEAWFWRIVRKQRLELFQGSMDGAFELIFGRRQTDHPLGAHKVAADVSKWW